MNLRDHGIEFGIFPTTDRNHICDIDGVELGHVTLNEGKDIHTGITVIKPHSGDVVKEKVLAGFYRGNGYGKFAGSTQIEETGLLESYIGLTNTLAVGTVLQELVRHHVTEQNDPDLISLNVPVGETNDAYLNNIASLPIKSEHVHQAIADLSSDNVAQGNLGAGTGTVAFGFKGGLGSAARVIPKEFAKTDRDYKIGVLMQSNYGGFLKLKGTDLWPELGKNRFEAELKAMEESKGSCCMLIATDAPVLPRTLERFARRAVAGLVGTGSFISHGSGDYALAWSTAIKQVPTGTKELQPHIEGKFLSEYSVDPFFQAIVECVEECLWNSMTNSETVEGHRKTIEKVPVEKVLELVK